MELGQMLMSPYGRVLDERLGSDLVRAPVSAFAAHASASPDVVGGATFALWQAFYHQVGQWHSVGGSQGLISALTRRFESLGGEWRTNAAVSRITRTGNRVTGIELESGERIEAANVITAIDPGVALLELLDPPLTGRMAERLRSTHRSNSVQMLVHLATTSLPQYPNARPGDWNGLQSYVDTVESLSDGFAQAQAMRLPANPVPTYSFTPSALDSSLAPPDHHTVYLACPTAPYRVDKGWGSQKEEFAERMIETVEQRAPGFRDTIVGMSIRTPEDMSAELHWPGAHPMYLDITLDQLGFMRPTRKLGNHRTEVEGLFISGAGTSPVGGVAATPGRAAARALLKHRKR